VGIVGIAVLIKESSKSLENTRDMGNITEPFQLRLDIVEHISNLRKYRRNVSLSVMIF
jgi:hypothetical protein